MTKQEKADELFLTFFMLNPYQQNHAVRTVITKQSAIMAVQKIQKYSENFIDDGFFDDVKKLLSKKV